MSRASGYAVIVVGISYIDLIGKVDDDVMQAAADDVGLELWSDMSTFDTLTDQFIGVVYRNKRPTDAEVAEATAKVEAAKPRLKELLGQASSGVETWFGVCVQ